MKKKFLSKLLTMLLVVSMMFTMLPASAIAYYDGGWSGLWNSRWNTWLDDSEDVTVDEQDAEMDIATQATNDAIRSVLLDCGRKYFSVADIERLIDTMSAYGYNELTLAFSNGGTRFVLDPDEMGLEYDDGSGTIKSVSGADVINKIEAGNEVFNGDKSVLTQEDMHSIIAYATKNGIEIVPLLNMPGHMEGILSSFSSYKDSKGNLNIDSEEACNFAYALLEKYVDYFASEGCRYFHFGADESQHTGDFMTNFLNGCADIITSSNPEMTPRAFNDATNVADMPTSVQITYWAYTWPWQSKHASELMTDYDMINTNGHWYYVIKSYDDADYKENPNKYNLVNLNGETAMVELPTWKAEKMDKKWAGIHEFFDSNSNNINTDSLGTMFCIWCDASQDDYLTADQVISTNEDYGALHQLQKLAEHYWPEDINKGGEETAPVVSTDDGDEVPPTVSVEQPLILTADKIVEWTTSDSAVLDIESADASTNGVAAFAAEKTVTAQSVKVTPVASGKATITAADVTDSTKSVSYRIEVQATETGTSVDVTLRVGESRTFDVDSSVSTGSKITGNDAYIAEAVVAAGIAQDASLREVTSIESGKQYLIVNQRSGLLLTSSPETWTTKGTACLLLSGTASATSTALWTLTSSGTGYTAEAATNQYLNIGNDTASVSSNSSNLTFAYKSTGGLENFSGYWNISYSDGNRYYLNNLGDTTAAGGWKYESNNWRSNNADSDNGSKWTLYEIVPGTPASNTLTITGVGESTKDVTIGNVTYHIIVTAPSFTESKSLTYNSTMSLPDTAVNVVLSEGSNCVTLNNNILTAGDTDGHAAVTFDIQNEGGYVTAHYTYNIAVSNVDLSEVAELPVELWVTNMPIGKDANSPTDRWNDLSITKSGTTTICNPATMQISAVDASNPDGTKLSSLVLSEGVSYDEDGNVKVYTDSDGNVKAYTYFFWKGVVLHDGMKQYHANGDNQDKADHSSSGTNFELIRWNNEWQYYADGTWKDVLEDDTLIAYYMQKFTVSSEIVTGTKDWGAPAHGEGIPSWGADSPVGFFGTGFAVVYPGGKLNRTEQEIYENMMVRYAYSAGSNPGMIVAQNNSSYRISKITITSGAYNRTDTSKVWTADGSVNWDKKLLEDGKTQWYDETTIWEADNADYSSEPMVNFDQLNDERWTAKEGDEAFLILVYLTVVENDDNLTVVYWDDSNKMQIDDPTKPIQIVVQEGKTFTDDIMPTPPEHTGKIELADDAYVVNKSGNKVPINKNLLTVPTALEKYKSGVYEYVRAEISEDGKTLTLHYAIDSSKVKATYVLDFGLPLKIEMSKLVDNADSIKSVTWNNDRLKAGTLTYENGVLTYTPTKVLTEALYMPFTLDYGNSTGIITIGVIPASNVLYEENFLTLQGTAAGGISWREGGNVVATTTAQQTQKVGDTDPSYSVFGYDVAYAGKTGDSGYWKLGDAADAAKQLQYSKFYSTYLKTTFYGNGFDLIGNCGPDTGRVIAVLTNTSTDETYIGDVDTRYTDGSETTLYQVPLMHMELPEGIYSVKIYGGGLDKTEVTVQGNSAAQNSISTQSMAMPVYSYDAMLESVLRANDLTMSDVEYVKVSSADSAAASAASSSAFATYAATNDAAEPKTITHEAGTHVEIDGFRVYRSSDNSNYPEAEKNVKYVNVLDAVGEIVAYREGDQAGNNSEAVNIQDYEATGGPQNEIYLTGGQAVIFAIEGLSAEDKVQVSLRAASGSAANTGKAFATNTELYYELSPMPMPLNGRTVYVVANTSDGILAVGNFKLPNNAAVITASKLPTETVTAAYSMAMNAAPVNPEPEQPLVFEPEYFHIRDYATRLFRSKLVTLRIDFSSDVSYVTIDGVRYNPSRLAGWFGYHTVTFTDTIDRNDVYLYKIVFYDANGNPSATQLVYGN